MSDHAINLTGNWLAEFLFPRRVFRGLIYGLLLATFFAASHGLFAHDEAKASPTGVIYLLKADRADTPSRDLAKEPCWTNPHVDGVLLRTHWNKIQPQPGAINWSFFDKGLALAAQYHKKVGLLVTAGVTTPEWVYESGALRFAVTSPNKRKMSAPMHQPLPWQAAFQSKWGQVIRELGKRYDGNPQVAYVVMGGSGRRAESFFVWAPGDIGAFNRVGGLASWKRGVKWITDEYASSFPTTPFLLASGAPVPSAEGRAALATVCDYGSKTYPHRFGVRSDGLRATYDLGSFGAREIKTLSDMTTVGFQMSIPSKGGKDVQGHFLLAEALKRGIALGAHFIEVYAVDCNLPSEAPFLDDASVALKKAGHQQ